MKLGKNFRLVAFSALMLLAIAAIALGGALGGGATTATLPAGRGATGPEISGPAASSAANKPEGIWAQPAQEKTYPNGARVVQEIKHDTSPPMRDIVPAPAVPRKAENENELPFSVPEVNVVDQVVQKHFGAMAMPTPILVFNGINQAGSFCGCLPPDTNGDVGPNHYVQTVNVAYAIWDKNGNVVQASRPFNSLFTGFGGTCETSNDGDPIVLYDHLADRWFINQFTSGAPYTQCIAVSTTGDPTGSYHRYAFQTSLTDFYDYQKFGVWPDAYYFTANVFEGDGGFRPSAAAFDRTRMLAGQSATYVEFNPGNFYGNLLPSDLDGQAPPVGTPNYFATMSGTSDRIRMWKFHVDFTTPANSTFTGPFNVLVAPFDPNLCGGARNCIPQQGTAARLDSLNDRPMHRLVYRNFGTHETLMTNHSVDVGADKAGVRWYELRSAAGAGNFSVYQQGTFAPDDGLHRWMGSMAMDGSGNLAVGYSTSSSTSFPAIKYAGRLATDPLGTLGQGEALMHQGTGSQTSGSSRWGDYSAMVIDESDDCTFWYTTEDYDVNSSSNWQTRIGKFRFTECTGNPPPTATPGGPTATSTPVATSTPGPACGQYTFTQSSGTYETATGTELGVRCDDCSVYITLPFPVRLYDRVFNNGFLSSNGVLGLGSGDFPFGNSCLPVPVHAYAIMALWDDLDTRVSACSTCGVFPMLTGTAPNRTYILEWRTEVLNNNGTPANFEIKLHENSEAFEIVYGTVINGTSDYTIGVQRFGNDFTQVLCSAAPITPNTQYSFTQPCFSNTPTPGPTNTVPPTVTSTPGPVCLIQFTDVPPGATFYNEIRCLACRNIIDGYACGGTNPETGAPEPCDPMNNAYFRPNNRVIRGQIAKIVSNSSNDNSAPGPQIYADVPTSQTFFAFINRLTNRGVMGGYPCGSPGEPCNAQNQPYFRPFNNATRGQIAQITARGANVNDPVPAGTQSFTDVPINSTFYVPVEQLRARGVMGGFPCGGVNPQTGQAEPCDSQNRAYFRVNNNATRGQTAQIVSRTFFPGCITP